MKATEWMLGKHLKITPALATQKLAFLGTSGSGKTYGAGVLVEGLVAMGCQVIVIDTVGNWWGLRVDASGKGPGLDIPIVGGDRGDLPMAPEHGQLMAETVASSRSSMILDVSDFDDGELRRFVITFAKTLLHAKKKSPTPVMVVWEECQDIIPQQMYGDDAKMVGAVQRLIKRGRNYGVGTTLISQRTAAVNKGCLNQIETMFAFRTSAPLDRKAISDWVDHVGAEPIAVKAGKNRPGRLTDQLPQLETGSAILYSPHYFERFEVMRLGEKKTFDASKTPEYGDVVTNKHLGAVNLRELEGKLAAVKREAEENDVGKLKARIKELEGKLAHGSDQQYDKQQVELLKSKVFALEATNKMLRELAEHRQLLHDRVVRASETAVKLLTEAVITNRPPTVLEVMNQAGHDLSGADGDIPELESRVREGGDDDQNDNLSKMERAFLTALAQYGAMGKARLRTVTGYAASGPVSTAFGKLLREKWVTDTGGQLAITPRGRDELGHYERLPQGDKLRHQLLNGSSRLSGMEKKLLEVVCKSYPSAVPKAKVRELAGYAASGPVSTAFGKLKALGYVLPSGANNVVASKDLFG